MPKQRINREAVVGAAFDIARREGMEQVLIKNIAARIGCSVQPIYSYCKNMEGLRQAVADRAADFVRAYIAEHARAEELFRSTGQAFIRLAQEEPQLFRIYILRKRARIDSLEALYAAETDPRVAERIAAQLGISLEKARELHMSMMIYNIGLGAVFAVTTPGVSVQEIYARQETAYTAFLRQALEEE